LTYGTGTDETCTRACWLGGKSLLGRKKGGERSRPRNSTSNDILKIGCMEEIVRKWVRRSKRKELDDVPGPNRTGVSRTSKEFYVEDGTSSVYVKKNGTLTV
jgi:hypothetical protein